MLAASMRALCALNAIMQGVVSREMVQDGTRTSHPSLAATSHPMMLQYDYALNALAGLDPAKIKCGSHKQVHWICHNCPKGQVHRWTVSPNQRFHHHKGRGCPYCREVVHIAATRRLASAIRCKADVHRLLLSGTTAEMLRHQMIILLALGLLFGGHSHNAQVGNKPLVHVHFTD